MKIRKSNPYVIPFQQTALLMSEKDNVAVARTEIKKNTTVIRNDNLIRIHDVIPKGHRFSLEDIRKNEAVIQYGYFFGLSMGIKKGRKIDSDNVRAYWNDNYKKMIGEIFGKKKYSRNGKCPLSREFSGRTFMGYSRKNGKVGTRNYYLILPTSLCAGDVAVKIADSIENDKALMRRYKNIDGIAAAAHTEGCGCNDGGIIDRLLLTLRNTVMHPNTGGALIIDLGCEKTNLKAVARYFSGLSRCGKPVDYISIQGLGGTGRAIAEGRRLVLSRLHEVNLTVREEAPIKHLIIGTECGASDSFSGITANPLIGSTVDRIIGAGGSAILSETPEMLGAEESLIKRMTSKNVAEKFVKGMNYYKSIADRLNVSMDGNFVAGNKAGGLVNLTLKSLGAILKGGTTSIIDFLDYAEMIKHRGLSIMNGPGNDLESMTGIVASGANIILFSTGMGTTEGNLLVPVIKIATRTEIYEKMKEDMDFNAGVLMDNSESLEKLSARLMDMTINVASGKKTWAEVWRKRSFQIWSAGKLSL